MKILIAGATGLIGRRLTEALLDAGHAVIVLTRTMEAARLFRHGAVQFVPWDGRSDGGWCTFVEDTDAVINLCGQSLGSRRWSDSRKQVLISSRIDPTTAIIRAINNARTKPGVLINASAVGLYGNVEDGNVTENDPAGTDFLASLCVRWESAALSCGDPSVRVVLLRSAVVLDPDGGALARMQFPFRLFVGGPLGPGRQWFPWIHQADELRAILFCLGNSGLSGPVNLVAPDAVTMREFCTELGKVTGRPSWLPVPAAVLKLVLGEMAEMVLKGQKVRPEKLEEAGFEFRFPSLHSALTDLLKRR